MAQVDLINYFPMLFWFIFLFCFFYFLIFTSILPLFFNTLKVRYYFFQELIVKIFSYSLFIVFLKNFYFFAKNSFFLFVIVELAIKNLYMHKVLKNILVKMI